MNKHIFSDIADAIKSSEETYKIGTGIKNAIIVLPVLIAFVQALLWLHPKTRILSLWMLRENHPVELLTFILLAAAGIIGLVLAGKIRKDEETKLASTFYILFSLCLLVIAMEEVAWGQWFFGFETPEAWQSINRQGETTLHNVAGLQGHSEIMRLAFGIGGLIGIWFNVFPAFKKIAVPVLLLPWFTVITLHASIDVVNDIVTLQKQFDYAIEKTSELIECFIAISAFLYVWLNSRMMRSSE